MSLGVALKDSGKLDEAVEQWLYVLRIEPEHARANYNLGTAMIRQGKIAEAIAYFTNAVRGEVDFADAHNSLGSVLIQDGKIDAAIYQFQEALRIDPDTANARNNLEKANRILKIIESDIAVLKDRQQKEPDNPVYIFQLGNLYYDIGRWPEAADAYEKTIALAPDFVEATNNLGLAYKRQEEYEKALETFQTLIQRQPEIGVAYYNMACIYALQNEVDQSIDWLTRAIARGYVNWELIKTDSDLDNIRDSSAYKELIKGH
jgi:tetratricopeptide (TPR) repeat protein